MSSACDVKEKVGMVRDRGGTRDGYEKNAMFDDSGRPRYSDVVD